MKARLVEVLLQEVAQGRHYLEADRERQKTSPEEGMFLCGETGYFCRECPRMISADAQAQVQSEACSYSV